MSQSLIYVTASGREEALNLARVLVESRLVACANVLDGATSLYWWEGKVAEEREAVMICKTRSALVQAVIHRLKELHSYDCPCVVVMPIATGNPDFLAWVDAETAPAIT
ncbi:dihydroorotate dehydrogenase [Paramagnetospirillum marisnigri]|uniref:Dihydroorotate dehydrogenase n=1 Tax=Paramagnetospirillum marisnigri TaxID=1285242 RepID=A0A178M577_9PROT|nr:divalent-cation tolerance protein CutA [Paramagnetospirillum marisnigri]OAN43912.1 dihydroorotate dehydrogenase [Paramagnetospirillum marisnigri]